MALVVLYMFCALCLSFVFPFSVAFPVLCRALPGLPPTACSLMLRFVYDVPLVVTKQLLLCAMLFRSLLRVILHGNLDWKRVQTANDE